MNDDTSKTELQQVQGVEDKFLTVLNSVFLPPLTGSTIVYKTVIHKPTGVVGTPIKIYSPGECISKTDLPIPSDVYVVEFQEGHRFMIPPNKIDAGYVGSTFDILKVNEANYFKLVLNTFNMCMTDLGTMAKTMNLENVDRAIELLTAALKEMVRGLK